MAQPNEPAGTAADPLAALTAALKLLLPTQPATTLKLPPLNGICPTNMISSNYFESLQRAGFHLQAIPDEPDDKGACLEYTLNFLGTTGCQKWNQWTLAGANIDYITATKNSAKILLGHLAYQIDYTVSQLC